MRLDQARLLNKRLETQLQGLRDPGFLKQKIKDLKLSLAEPPRSQLWILPEPSRESFPPNLEREYVLQDRGNMNFPMKTKPQ